MSLLQLQLSPYAVATRLQKRFHLRVSEWLMAVIMVTWGVELIASPTMFSAPYYYELARFAPQSYWAAAVLVIGTGRLAALGINGAWRFSPHVRALAAILSCLVWTEVALGLAHFSRVSLGLASYPWMACADFYALFRAAGDARFSDEKAKLPSTLV